MSLKIVSKNLHWCSTYVHAWLVHWKFPLFKYKELKNSSWKNLTLFRQASLIVNTEFFTTPLSPWRNSRKYNVYHWNIHFVFSPSSLLVLVSLIIYTLLLLSLEAHFAPQFGSTDLALSVLTPRSETGGSPSKLYVHARKEQPHTQHIQILTVSTGDHQTSYL